MVGWEWSGVRREVQGEAGSPAGDGTGGRGWHVGGKGDGVGLSSHVHSPSRTQGEGSAGGAAGPLPSSPTRPREAWDGRAGRSHNYCII